MDLSTTDKLSAMLGSIVPTFLGYISSIVVYEGTSYQWRLCYKDQAFKFIFIKLSNIRRRSCSWFYWRCLL